MKFFLDSANLDELKRALAWGIIDGVTTNPSLIAKERAPLVDQLRAICDLIEGDVSAPVLATRAHEMLIEARELAGIHRNIVVKVPMTEEGIKAVAALSKEGIRTNVTLCFTPEQALVAAKAGAYYVSPFYARVEDAGGSGSELIRDILKIYSNYGFQTQVLAASLRGPAHVVEAAKAGAHVATLPYKIVESLFAHPLTERGIEQFANDYNRVFDLAKTTQAS
jgi:transaldolase